MRVTGGQKTHGARKTPEGGVGFRLLIFIDKQSGNPRRGVDMSDDGGGPAGSQPHIM